MGLIYHYTDCYGLHGILESDSLWLTDRNFLNDPTEGEYAKEVYREDISVFAKSCPNGNARKVNEIIESEMSLGVVIRNYIGSFSDPDLLSQWRGYCPPQGGYCIGFEDSVLSELSEGIKILKCKYSKEETLRKWHELAGRIDAFLSKFSDMATEPKDTPPELRLEEIDIREEIASLLITHKHPSYEDEREQRLVCTKIAHSEQPLPTHFRPKDGNLVPYIKLPGIKSSIKEIIVGPSPHIEIRRKALDEYRFYKQYPFELKRTQIPYRG